eukprot:gene6615-3268_t
MGRYVIGEVSFAECIDYEADKAARIHLIPRPSGLPRDEKLPQAPVVLDLPSLVSFDSVNAYEMDGGNMLVADVVAQEGTHFFKDMATSVTGYYRGAPKPELTRVVENIKERSVSYYRGAPKPELTRVVENIKERSVSAQVTTVVLHNPNPNVNTNSNSTGYYLDTPKPELTRVVVNIKERSVSYYRGAPKPELTRVVVNVKERSVSAQVLSHRSLDAGVVNPSRVGRPHKHAWVTGALNEDAENWGPCQVRGSGCIWVSGALTEDADNWGPCQVITKLNLSPSNGLPYANGNGSTSRLNRVSTITSETWAPGPKDFVGPCTFVPKANGTKEDDGWLITMLHNAGGQNGGKESTKDQARGRLPQKLEAAQQKQPVPG